MYVSMGRLVAVLGWVQSSVSWEMGGNRMAAAVFWGSKVELRQYRQQPMLDAFGDASHSPAVAAWTIIHCLRAQALRSAFAEATLRSTFMQSWTDTPPQKCDLNGDDQITPAYVRDRAPNRKPAAQPSHRFLAPARIDKRARKLPVRTRM
jgi:hypothetical protein